jgi:hypothetical protein
VAFTKQPALSAGLRVCNNYTIIPSAGSPFFLLSLSKVQIIRENVVKNEKAAVGVEPTK